ncbi:hypothetical protein C8J27_104153 [Rhodobacter aestuarii]|uniref:Aminopeptidase n=1 Tax=Rhodobacter aestuarii TaxID=453582 RepID=A0A1N7KXA6_9RHOB|nr:AbrB family transcriptional regulator [Rhodobacter aestuarii]PTV95517.1 hypothetical protein C8J27_104153 [Rhodobacter aestuarii]SIS66228.1 hypothetical protein SAMN05421580_103101 [Rhodobacter aestuarii]
MRPIPRFTPDLHPASLVATLALGTVGGFVAKALHLPLPMLVGSLLAVGTAALAGLKPLGRAVQFPAKLRLFFIPVIGVAIGASFTPEILRGAVAWLPSLAALCLFIPLAHYLSFRALRATGTLDPITAFFGAAPGGLIETVQMGEEMGGDARMLTMLQFLRLITTLIAVPLFFTALSGHAVGSAGGASMSRTQPGAIDLLWLLGAGVTGGLIGWRLKIPGGMVTGPILISALVHLSGLAQGAPPGWLVALTQLIIGTSLGVRFAGMELRRFWLALRLAGLSTSISIGLAAIFAFALARWVDEPISAVFLAFAPGGLVEMSLVALSLQLSAVFVTAHHALRIVLAVAAARALAPRLAK